MDGQGGVHLRIVFRRGSRQHGLGKTMLGGEGWAAIFTGASMEFVSDGGDRIRNYQRKRA